MIDRPHNTVAPTRQRRRRKLIRETEAGRVIRLPNGRDFYFELRCDPETGKRSRKIHREFRGDEAAAGAEFDRLAELSAQPVGQVVNNGANTTLSELFALHLADKNPNPGWRKVLESKMRTIEKAQPLPGAHNMKPFGTWTLKALEADEFRSVQKWLDDLAEAGIGRGRGVIGMGEGTVKQYKGVFDGAFLYAVGLRREGRNKLVKTGKPKLLLTNPLLDHPITVSKKAREKEPGKVLSLKNLSAVIKAVMTKTKRADCEDGTPWDKDESTFLMRAAAVVGIGLFTGFRNEEGGGLRWVNVDLKERRIYMRDVLRDGEHVLEDSKTGKHGLRGFPLSPVAVAILAQYRQRMAALKLPVGDDDLVLITARAKKGVTTDAICQTHWPQIARKAQAFGGDFFNADGSLKHTYYDLRHTFANMGEKIGITLYRLAKMMGHKTTRQLEESYLHNTPDTDSYNVITREVNLFIMANPSLQGRTDADLIEALGQVLAKRWQAERIEVGCAPLRVAPQQIAYDKSHEPKLLTSNDVIDVIPTPMLSLDLPQPPQTMSRQVLREWQIKNAPLYARAGWTKHRLAAEWNVDHNYIARWIREADLPIPVVRGWYTAEGLKAAKQKVIAYMEKHPDATSFDVTAATGVDDRRAAEFMRKYGKPIKHRKSAYKYGPLSSAIRRMTAEGKSLREQEAVLKAEGHVVTASGIGWHLKNVLKLKTKTLGPGMRADQFDAEIIRGVAEGKNGKQIAAELHDVHQGKGPSHGAVCNRIRDLGLLTEEKRRNNAARARAQNKLRRQQVRSVSGKQSWQSVGRSPKTQRKMGTSAA